MTNQLKSKNINDAYSEYEDLRKDLLKAALDERKMFSIDRHNIQITHIRQSLYLSITMAGAICTVAANTPFFSKTPIFSGGSALMVFGLGIALFLCLTVFCFGAFALRGERDGRRFKLDNIGAGAEDFVQIANLACKPDGDGTAEKVRGIFLSHVSKCLKECYDDAGKKASKIRLLNTLIVCAAVIASISSAAIVSSTFFRNFHGIGTTSDTAGYECRLSTTDATTVGSKSAVSGSEPTSDVAGTKSAP